MGDKSKWEKERSGDSTAATGTGTSRTAITMLPGDNSPLRELGKVKIRDVIRGAMIYGKVQHLVKITIIKVAIPADRQDGAAHYICRSPRIVGSMQFFHVTVIITRMDQVNQKSADGHIGNRKKIVKFDAMPG